MCVTILSNKIGIGLLFFFFSFFVYRGKIGGGSASVVVKKYEKANSIFNISVVILNKKDKVFPYLYVGLLAKGPLKNLVTFVQNLFRKL